MFIFILLIIVVIIFIMIIPISKELGEYDPVSNYQNKISIYYLNKRATNKLKWDKIKETRELTNKETWQLMYDRIEGVDLRGVDTQSTYSLRRALEKSVEIHKIINALEKKRKEEIKSNKKEKK